MPSRFVMEVDATYEGAFAACGKHFAYLSPDEETAATLYQEAGKWYVARERSGVVDHDDYGEYDIDPTVKRLTPGSVGSLSEPRGIYDDAFDILLCEGRVAGFVVYTGKDTDRYGFQNPAPIYAKADYDIPPHFFRPDPREVVIDFSILYVDGRTLGKCKKSFSIWDDRQNKYYHDAFTLEKA